MRKEKREALDLIRRMPDSVTTADILQELLFKQQVDAGLRDIAEGRTIPHSALRRKVARWRKSAGR